MTIEFAAWPSIARLYREAVVTEKIDGSNAAVVVKEVSPATEGNKEVESDYVRTVRLGETVYEFAAQSRKRLISPEDDNFGFAEWVWKNAHDLVVLLGEGRHFGEWWGSGIQRGYGLPKGEKRFSLFNTPRWRDTDLSIVPDLYMVPELYVGPFSVSEIESVKHILRATGSKAAPGFRDPEGIVVYHTAARTAFKTTFDACDDPSWGGGKTWQNS